MNWQAKFNFLTSIAAGIALTFAMCNETQAGWGSWGGGSRGGYGSGGSSGLFGAYGSHGSSGFSSRGSSGSHGSLGGRRVLFPRIRSLFSGSHGSHGSSGGYGSGGYGSSGGSHGSHGSSGGYGSHGSSGGGYSYYGNGSHGSSGGGSHGSVGGVNNYYDGSIQNQGGTIDGGIYAPGPYDSQYYPSDGIIPQNGTIIEGTLDGVVPPTGPVIESPNNSGGDGNSTSTGNAILNVSVPLDAKVYVNGKLTRTKGENRRFVSRALRTGKTYTYEVQAVVAGRGVMTRMVDLRVGDDKPVKFDFEDTSDKITSVTVQVPVNAEVVLAGNKSATRGPVRFFSTKTLKPGESWNNYTVEVSFNVDGRKVTRSKTVTIEGGKSHEIDFMDEYDQIARR